MGLDAPVSSRSISRSRRSKCSAHSTGQRDAISVSCRFVRCITWSQQQTHMTKQSTAEE
jgi:hypothetical protein